MDVGTAAVIAAGLGIGGVLLGAIGNGALTARTIRRQVKDRGDVEHRHWLRQQRQEAYTTFLTACDAVLDALAVIATLRENPDSQVDVEPLWDAYDKAHRTAGRAWVIVRIVGPDEMRQRAFKLQSYFTELSKVYRAPPDLANLWTWSNALIVYSLRHGRFLAGARIVLTSPPSNGRLQDP
ncbi:hypothetical protein HET69_34640 [Streptomyces sp. CJ_13]|uniref:hypothetical protein n=1 Tax=Streptomyces sp. CJ_13 TaxID=2724943 RepID=UPI001BDD6092|nr:hypothetical protein [Streptomyces sp. CJ_13]MBT1188987.1 hypothetical protein [Streptomyces sp. CJ_13]